mmetsp:Transcript_12844/g.53975  ORF Transcript_12844/g.53975 Transcript_12844/m.53975 type:complete len:257 (+) Transcript_12844:397-1167(+)
MCGRALGPVAAPLRRKLHGRADGHVPGRARELVGGADGQVPARRPGRHALVRGARLVPRRERAGGAASNARRGRMDALRAALRRIRQVRRVVRQCQRHEPRGGIQPLLGAGPAWPRGDRVRYDTLGWRRPAHAICAGLQSGLKRTVRARSHRGARRGGRLRTQQGFQRADRHPFLAAPGQRHGRERRDQARARAVEAIRHQSAHTAHRPSEEVRRRCGCDAAGRWLGVVECRHCDCGLAHPVCSAAQERVLQPQIR